MFAFTTPTGYQGNELGEFRVSEPKYSSVSSTLRLMMTKQRAADVVECPE